MAKYPENSMAAIFQNRVEENTTKACVAYKNKEGKYIDISWNEMNDMVWNLVFSALKGGATPGQGGPVFSQPV